MLKAAGKIKKKDPGYEVGMILKMMICLPFLHIVHPSRRECPLIVYAKPTLPSAPSPVRIGPSWVPVDALSI